MKALKDSCKQNLEISDDKFKMWEMCFRIGTVANTNNFNKKKPRRQRQNETSGIV